MYIYIYIYIYIYAYINNRPMETTTEARRQCQELCLINGHPWFFTIVSDNNILFFPSIHILYGISVNCPAELLNHILHFISCTGSSNASGRSARRAATARTSWSPRQLSSPPCSPRSSRTPQLVRTHIYM